MSRLLPTVSPLFPSLLLLHALAAPAAAQYVIYGAGCGQPLTISSDTQPFLGMTYNLRLSQAPANSLALLILGFQATALPLGGCTLLASPDVILALPTDGNGQAEYNIPMPVDPSLVGISLYNQWAVFNPAQQFLPFDFSAGGCSTVQNPQMTVLAITPPSITLGTTVTVQAQGLGTTDPANICGGFELGNGKRLLLRATSIVHDPITGIDTLVGKIETQPFEPGTQLGHLMLMRGDGTTLAGPAPFGNGPWAWAGPGQQQAGAMGPPVQVTPPPPPLGEFPFTYHGGANPCIRATIPAGTYAIGSKFIADEHHNVVNSQPRHYDTFLPAIVTTSVMNEFQVRDLIAAALQNAFDVARPGEVDVQTPSGAATIDVRMHGGVQLQVGYAVGRVYWR